MLGVNLQRSAGDRFDVGACPHRRVRGGGARLPLLLVCATTSTATVTSLLWEKRAALEGACGDGSNGSSSRSRALGCRSRAAAPPFVLGRRRGWQQQAAARSVAQTQRIATIFDLRPIRTFPAPIHRSIHNGSASGLQAGGRPPVGRGGPVGAGVQHWWVPCASCGAVACSFPASLARCTVQWAASRDAWQHIGRLFITMGSVWRLGSRRVCRLPVEGRESIAQRSMRSARGSCTAASLPSTAAVQSRGTSDRRPRERIGCADR